MATTQTCPFGPGFDFTNPDVLEQGIPVAEFADLRKTAPVWWNEQPESIFNDGGYCVISRYNRLFACAASLSEGPGSRCAPRAFRHQVNCR